MSGSENGEEGLPRAGRYLDAPIGAARNPEGGVRWRRMLTFFMRLTALVWLLKGLMYWAFIIGLYEPGFPDLRLSRQGIIIVFAVLDIVAATGLWLVASWGAAVWLLVLIVEAALPFVVPDLVRPLTDAVMAAVFGAIYLFFVWRAVQEEDRL